MRDYSKLLHADVLIILVENLDHFSARIEASHFAPDDMLVCYIDFSTLNCLGYEKFVGGKSTVSTDREDKLCEEIAKQNYEMR